MHTDRSFACSQTHLTVERARLRLTRSLLLHTAHKSCEPYLCRILRRYRLPPGLLLEASPCYLKPPPAVAARRGASAAAAAVFAAAAAAAGCCWLLLPPLTAAAAAAACCCCCRVVAEVPAQGEQGAKASALMLHSVQQARIWSGKRTRQRKYGARSKAARGEKVSTHLLESMPSKTLST